MTITSKSSIICIAILAGIIGTFLLLAKDANGSMSNGNSTPTTVSKNLNNALARTNNGHIRANACIIVAVTQAENQNCTSPNTSIGKTETIGLTEVDSIISEQTKSSLYLRFHFSHKTFSHLQKASSLRRSSISGGVYQSTPTKDGFANRNSQAAHEYLIQEGVSYRKQFRLCNGLQDLSIPEFPAPSLIINGENQQEILREIRHLHTLCSK